MHVLLESWQETLPKLKASSFSDVFQPTKLQQYSSISEYSSTKMNAKPSKPQRRRISSPMHARCWIDNAAAVAWIGRHYATNTTDQELTRVLSCAEIELKIHVSTSHLQGSSNLLADLGSRSWSGEKLVTWTNYMRLWQQREIPSLFRKINKSELPISSSVHSQTHQGPAISKRGGNRACFASVGNAEELVSEAQGRILQVHQPYRWRCGPRNQPTPKLAGPTSRQTEQLRVDR
ncbi:hypothetical protein JG687_00006790 [Phytophthora cactorum]|uniref:Uncharacterized protein n=1 Tax=Phytophthora cactorum TaxID=29920 RepID=A0A8T1UM28_9STRA|nr:hypothetical protein JG687_00006790 [Phytophthora cactorum]